MSSEASHTSDFTTAKDNVQTKIEDEKSQASIQEPPHYATLYPHVNESKLIRKIDLRLVPILSALYVLAFLDRVNIGNAALFGLKQDLKLGGNEYNTALVIFFVPYVLFEVPSNFLMKKFKPHVWLPLCLLAFGLVTILQGLTQTYSGILATRFFLGLYTLGHTLSQMLKRYTYHRSFRGGYVARVLLPYLNVVPEVRGSKTFYFFLLLDFFGWCLWWSPCERHREDEWNAGVPRVALGLHRGGCLDLHISIALLFPHP